jgi:hypothetical protein
LLLNESTLRSVSPVSKNYSIFWQKQLYRTAHRDLNEKATHVCWIDEKYKIYRILLHIADVWLLEFEQVLSDLCLDVLTAVIIKMAVCWVVAPCRLI